MLGRIGCSITHHYPLYPKYYSQLAEGIMVDRWRDFWIRETGTGQQVAKLHERYMMMTSTGTGQQVARLHERYMMMTSTWPHMKGFINTCVDTVHCNDEGLI
jgi:hypothetical protein